MDRFGLVAVVLLGAIFGLVPTDAAAAEPVRRVNSVVLFVDDLGWADLEHRLPDLPIDHIRSIAEDGVEFVNAYAASPTCSPSRAAMITGRHAARLGIVRHTAHDGSEFHMWEGDPAEFPSRNWLPLEERTYGEVLNDLGYQTAFVGKWHLGPEPYFPKYQGFDETYGVTRRGQPSSYYPPFFRGNTKVYADAKPDEYLTDRLTDDAVAFIQRQRPSRPFHLSLYYYAVHKPHVGRRDFVEALAAQGFEGEALQHAAMLLAVNESVGRIRNVLTESGHADDTLLIFAADQGGLFDNSPMRGGKMGGGAVFEGGARVPFYAAWPGVIEPGRTVETPISLLDVFPTLASISGYEWTTADVIDGDDLTPLLTGTGRLDRDQVVLYRSYESRYAAIRVGDWKLIAYRDGSAELFDLSEDPGEANDVCAEYPLVRAELIGRLISWEQAMGVDQYTPEFKR